VDPAGPPLAFLTRPRQASLGAGGAVLIEPPPIRRRVRRALAATLLLMLATALAGCSIQKMATKSVADSLTKGPDVFGTDDDPELVRDALPFGLKTMEALLQQMPQHEGLLLTLCKGFTQYSYAFVQSEGDLLVNSDYARASALHERAFNLYIRARDYGLRALALRHPGIADSLKLAPGRAVAKLDAKDLAPLYWCAASWGSAISLGKDRPEMLADLPAIRELVNRGLALDERYEGGAFHEAAIVLDALPPAMGGSVESARRHFERAVEISGDQRPSPYVTLAQSVSVLQQDRAEFRRLLERALQFDPNKDRSQRLETIVLQRKAKSLLERESDFFLDDASAPDSTTSKEKR
jgi:tetratricopeptide (TPR) repeat protein